MAYRSIESAIRGIVSEDNLAEAALGDYKGLLALAMRKSGDEQSAMKAAAEMMKKGQMKDLNMFMKAMDKSTHKAIMPFVDKKYNKALHEDMEIDEAQKPVSQMTPAEKAAHDARRKEYNEYQKSKRNEEVEIEEKTLTSAELKKREEVATAIERDNPDMPMGKKMAIATSTAKKVAEEVDPNVDMLNEFLSADELGQSMLDEIRGADVEDQHIIMQLRSAQDLEGKKDIRFRNKTSAKVAPKHIDKILKLHDHPSVKPVHKRQIRVAISKSHDHLKKFADQIKEETSLDEAAKVTDAQINKVLGPTKNAQQGIEALKKAFKVRDNEAKAMLNRVMSKEETSLDEAQYKVPSNYMAMMQKKKKADAGQQMSDDEKKKNITTADREKLSKLASMLKKEDVQEAADKEVKMATGIAFDKRYKGSNMTGATKAIEKIRKGLSDHPRVKSALRQANEDTQVEEKETGDHVRTSDYKMSKVRLPDGRMVYRKVKREIKV